MTLTIEGIEIGGTSPCRFVAELSCNHGGDLERMLRLIRAAKDTGAEFCKFQAYEASELVALRGDGPAPEPWGAQGFTMRTPYEKAHTPRHWFPQLFDYARSIGIVPFASVFGLESLVMLERCACPAYKIAALDNEQEQLMRAVESRRKPLLVSRSTGRRDKYWEVREYRLYCPAGYPTAAKDVHLPSYFGSQSSFLGLSSHCMDPLLPIAAVSRGAKLIEMHMQLADEPSELEANISLTEHQFAQMIHDVRQVEVMLA